MIMSKTSSGTISVIDVGARFGIHPTWRALKGSPVLRLAAFEPDANEVVRLAQKYQAFPNYQIHALALGNENKMGVLNLLGNRGFSSFLEPNAQETWFGVDRPGEGEVEERLSVPTRRLDDWCRDANFVPDFLKVDTEGSDLEVLQGAESVIDHHVLGIRCEVFFRELYRNVPEIDAVHQFLRAKGFVLASLDYNGKGSAQSYFCPHDRYGVLMGCEALYLRNDQYNLALPLERFVKLLIFLFLNYLEDLAVRYLVVREDVRDPNVRPAFPELWGTLERLFLLAAKKLQWTPGGAFQAAKDDYAKFFGASFPERHHFYESDSLNPA
jgi:FkbM family methyltransferase